MAGFTPPERGQIAPVRGGDDEIDSEALLEQGDELLRSSRELLEDLEDVVADPDEQSPTEPS